MGWDIAILVGIALCQGATGYWAFHMSTQPEHRFIRYGFAFVTAVGIGLIVWSGIRTTQEQEATNESIGRNMNRGFLNITSAIQALRCPPQKIAAVTPPAQPAPTVTVPTPTPRNNGERPKAKVPAPASPISPVGIGGSRVLDNVTANQIALELKALPPQKISVTSILGDGEFFRWRRNGSRY